MSFSSGQAAKPLKAWFLVTLAHAFLIWAIAHAIAPAQVHNPASTHQAVSVRFIDRAVPTVSAPKNQVTKPVSYKPKVTKPTASKPAISKPAASMALLAKSESSRSHSHTVAEEVASTPAQVPPTTQVDSDRPVDLPVASTRVTPGNAREDMSSVPAKLIGNPQPLYPSASRRFGEQGTVLIELLILSSGRVGQVRVKKSSGFARLDKAAVIATQSWTYQPAEYAGSPIDQWHTQPVTFAIN